MTQMRCISSSIGIVPSNIKKGKIYYLDEDNLLDNGRYGLFYEDSLKTNYVGLTEMKRMEEIKDDTCKML